MAILSKSRARKPLAENRVSYSWSNYHAEGEGVRYNMHVSSEYDEHGKSHSYALKLTPLEAVAFAIEVARHETNDPNTGTVDRRKPAHALRELADKLERG